MPISFTMPTMPKFKIAMSGVVLSAVLASGLGMGMMMTHERHGWTGQKFAGACHAKKKRHASATISLKTPKALSLSVTL